MFLRNPVHSRKPPYRARTGGLKVDANDSEGFFPEREVLRARRLKTKAAEAVDPSDARNRRSGMWVLWVAVFLPMFVDAISFGWDGHITPTALELLMYALSVVLVGCGALVAVGIWKNLRRANSPSC
jgi:hypothetical protein